MICPNCGAHIASTALRCPSCRADVDCTRTLPKQSASYCARCGSRVPTGLRACPYCNCPVVSDVFTSKVDVHAPRTHVTDRALDIEQELSEADLTTTIPRIGSAIPSFPGGNGFDDVRDHLPRLRILMVSLGFAVLFVSGLVLYITHPWNPNAFDTKAKVAADTAHAGFPGTKEELQGQDRSSVAQEDVTQSADDATYDKLKDAYESLGKLSTAVEDNEKQFRDSYASASREDLKKGQDTARDISLKISNVIKQLNAVNVESGTYQKDRSQLITLSNWLRNHMDKLTKGWSTALRYCGKPSCKQRVNSVFPTSDDASSSSFKAMFDQHYQDYKPTYRDPAK